MSDGAGSIVLAFMGALAVPVITGGILGYSIGHTQLNTHDLHVPLSDKVKDLAKYGEVTPKHICEEVVMFQNTLTEYLENGDNNGKTFQLSTEGCLLSFSNQQPKTP